MNPINSAAQSVDGVIVNRGLARILVFWLGRYAALARERYGAIPEGLVDAQRALAEAAAGSNSRQHERECLATTALLASQDDGETSRCVDTSSAAALLGVTADAVRWNIRRGHLSARRVGRQWMIDTASLAKLRESRERKAG